MQTANVVLREIFGCLSARTVLLVFHFSAAMGFAGSNALDHTKGSYNAELTRTNSNANLVENTSGVTVIEDQSLAGCTDLVVNGSFDAMVPNNGTGNGWTSSGNNASGGWSSTGGNPGAYFFLNNLGFSGDPQIEQNVVGLVVGQSYHVTGNYISVVRNESPAGATDSFVVELDSIIVFEAGPTADLVSDPNPTWATFDICFTATSTSMNLRMSAEANGSDNDFGVDNITVCENPCAIPAVSEWSAAILTLLLLVCGTLFIARRKPATS